MSAAGGSAPQPVSLVWRETESVLPSPVSRTITVQGQGQQQQPLFTFTLQSTAGAFVWPADRDGPLAQPATLSWQIESRGAAGRLTLVHHAPGAADVAPTRLVLHFPSQLFPGAVVVGPAVASTGGARGAVVGITAHGALFVIDLSDTLSDMQQHWQQQQGGMLAGMLNDCTVRFLDLGSQWAALGSPTCLTWAGEHVLVGGSLGPTLCLPAAALLDPATSRHLDTDLQALAGAAAPATSAGGHHAAHPAWARPFLLRESSWGIKSLIAGVWHGPRSPAVTAVMHHAPDTLNAAAHPRGAGHQGVLLVVYDDGSLRGFSLSRQAQLFSELLPCCTSPAGGSGGGATGGHRRMTVMQAVLCALPSSGGGGQAVMVVQLEALDTLCKSVHVLALSFPAGGGKPSLRVCMQCDADPAATLLSACAVGASALWLLYLQRDGSTRLVRHLLTGTDGQPAGAALLLERGMLPSAPAAGAGGGKGAAAMARALQQQGTGEAGSASAMSDAIEMAIWEELLETLSAPAALPEGSSGAAAAAVGPSPAALVGRAAEAQALARLLAPGTMHRGALCDALRCHGIALTAAEVSGSNRAELRALLTSAVDTIEHRSVGQSRARCWAQLLGSYQDAWSRLHPLLALAPLPDHTVATVRGGGVQGVLRPATTPEALPFADAPQACLLLSADSSANPLALPPAPLVQLPADLVKVQRAAQQLGALLGSWVRDAAVALLALGVAPASRLVACLARHVLEGSVAVGTRLDDTVQEQLGAWRRRRRKALLGVAAALAGVADLALALREYCHLLALPEPGQGSAAAGNGGGGGTGPYVGYSQSLFLTQACKQVVAAQAAACLEVLLLVHMVLAGQLPGPPLLRPGAQGQLAQQLVPWLEQLSCRAALVLWLAGTPSRNGAGASLWHSVEPSASVSLAALHLSSSPAGGGKPPKLRNGTTASTAAVAPLARDQSLLAGRLLPQLAPKLALHTQALAHASCAPATLVWLLQHNARGGGQALVQEQLLQQGYQLFVAQEFAALEGLARLAAAAPVAVGGAGTAALAAGMQLLEALSVVCSLRGLAQGSAAREAAVARASACFFHAAAGLQGGGASPLLLRILHDLTVHLTGSSATLPAGATPPLALQRQLYEAAMQVFEREGALEGALTFAQAALHLLQQQQEQQQGRGGDGDTLMQGEAVGELVPAAAAAELAAAEGRLWSNAFTYHCGLRRWPDAYTALVSNPDASQALDCLRRLVHELCEAGELAALCALPLAGVLVVPLLPEQAAATAAGPPSEAGGEGNESGGGGGITLVTLRAEAVAALQRRAVNSELTLQPQPYKVLYAFLVARGEYRQAAAAMVAYIWRLRAEAQRTIASVQAAITAYELAIHCLGVVEPSEAWLDGSSPWMAAHSSLAASAPGLQPHQLFSTLPAACAGSAASAGVGPRCVTAAQLARDAAVLRAAALLHATKAVAGMDPLHPQLDANEVLGHLLLAGQFDQALTLATEAWPAGSPANQAALEQVVGALAETAAHMQLTGNRAPGHAQGGPPELPTPLSLLSRDPQRQRALLGCSHLASPAAPLWSRLRALLLDPALLTLGGALVPAGVLGALRVAAADAVLRTDRNMKLPVWLSQLFTEPPVLLDDDGAAGSQTGMAVASCGPASLLELYLRHERLEEAVALVVGALASWGCVDARRRQRHASTWFPHTRIKVLRARLVRDVERGGGAAATQAAGAWLLQLDDALVAHAELLASDGAAAVAHTMGMAVV